MNKQEKEIIKNVVKRADVMIEKLSVWVDEVKDIKATSLAQLAESDEKPKRPKPWDVIEWTGKKVTNTGANLVLDKDTEQIRIRDGVKGTISKMGSNDNFIKLFNLKDHIADLAALKPIKEFHRPKSHSLGNTEFHVNLCESGDVDFVVGDEYVCFTSKEFSEITLKCRCMELRMIQDAAKQ